MRTKTFTTLILLTTLLSCGERNNQPTGDIITINVTARFPHKELIVQDFMNVEYIILEDADDFLTQGGVLDIGNEIILVRNNIPDGNIYVFDRNGKGLRVINRMGQGGEEYIRIHMALLDEENRQIFVADFRRVLVYDFYGNFIRSFPIENLRRLRRFDSEHLIGIETSVEINEHSTESQPFVLISKKDGSIVNDIRIGLEQGINPTVTGTLGDGRMFSLYLPGNVNPFVPSRYGWILSELASDTIFRLLPDFTKEPFIVRRPAVHSMNSEIFLLPKLITERYYFFHTFHRDFQSSRNFTHLMYDTQENTVFRYTLYNGDFYPKRAISLSSFSAVEIDIDSGRIAFIHNIEAYQLVEAYENGELRGRLKEIASKLHEDSNPVIMLVKH